MMSKNKKNNIDLKEYTAEDLISAFKTAGIINSLYYMLAPDHQSRLEYLECILNEIYLEIIVNRHITHVEGEDQLSLRIVSALRALGIEASHDTQIGGHVDILVRASGGFMWFAEAKIDKGNAWLLKGYKQLTTRYVPGVAGSDSADLLVYCKRGNPVKTMEAWRVRVSCLNGCQFEQDSISADLSFRTRHVSEVSGMLIKIRHIALPLFFDPSD